MHLLRVEEGGALYDSDEAVDLGQPPGDIIIPHGGYRGQPAVERGFGVAESGRCANGTDCQLSEPVASFSVDQYIANTVAGAKLVIVRLLGGSALVLRSPAATCPGRGRRCAGGIPAGNSRPDPELDYLSTVGTVQCHGLAAYLDAGGPDNAASF